MSQLTIEGPTKLSGEINISGAKNAALKILPAAILAKTPSTINNVPNILDIDRMIDILESIGVVIERDNTSIKIDPSNINSFKPDAHLIKKLRGSIVIVGPLLTRFGQAVFSQPGGCLIGSRPIDDHLDIFSQLGIKAELIDDEYHLEGKPQANEIVLNKMSVTATENAIMSSVLSPGITKIHVAAAEPEIIDLANYLNMMGAKIQGAGTHEITIEGVEELNGVEYTVMPDRIEAGTYLIAAIATNSNLTIGPFVPNHLAIVLRKLEMMGAHFNIIQRSGQHFIETLEHGALQATNIDTRTYPGFPTDLQSPFAILLSQANGQSRIFETLFEGRFLYLPEVQKMGMKYEILSPHIITINGPTKLKGRKIICQDIRGGGSLVIAALLANGTTVIDQCEYIDRGYESIDKKLSQAGAHISRVD